MKLSIVNWTELSFREQKTLIQRPQAADVAIGPKVAEILSRVRIEGDEAVGRFSEQFDGSKEKIAEAIQKQLLSY